MTDAQRFKSLAVPTGKVDVVLDTMPIPTYDGFYAADNNALPERYVYDINRDALMADLFEKLTEA